jgi:hypothetical protein
MSTHVINMGTHVNDKGANDMSTHVSDMDADVNDMGNHAIGLSAHRI